MQEVTTRAALQRALAARPRPLGFVPTMGYLHAGHGSLLARARAENGTSVLSIFVNPTQFGPGEDFARYPRDLAHDRALAESAGTDVLFVPAVDDIYPPGAATWTEVEGLGRRWEGEHRPGHFRGVATVVLKLFLSVRPDQAYFGEKDYQQLQIVKRLAADLLPELRVVGCPTVREPDGLALSSRNTYLTTAARERALGLSSALARASALVAAGERSGPTVEAAMRTVLNEAGLAVDYAAVVDAATLEPLARLDRPARALLAARAASVRLIDNAALLPESAAAAGP